MKLKLQRHQALPQLAQAGPSLLQDQPSVAHNPLHAEFLHPLQKSSKQQRPQQHLRDERKQAAPSSTPIGPQNQRIELDGCRQMQHTLPQLTSAASASSTARAPQPAAPAAPSQKQRPQQQPSPQPQPPAQFVRQALSPICQASSTTRAQQYAAPSQEQRQQQQPSIQLPQLQYQGGLPRQ